MESISLIELAGHFNEKLSTLKTVYDLRETGKDRECDKHLGTIATELESLEMLMVLFRQEVKKQTEQLKSIKEMRNNFDKLMKDLDYTSNNIPSRLPSNNSTTHSTQNSEKVNSNRNNAVNEACNNVAPPVKKVPVTKKHCPSIDYITVEEFNDVPKYMKGRVAYNQVNSLIDELNKTFTAKYKTVHMKRSTMNDVARKRYENYKSQESKDTEGVYFIVEGDIKDFSTIKMDAVTRSILTTLRHCGRLREIRGGKITRFAIIESY